MDPSPYTETICRVLAQEKRMSLEDKEDAFQDIQIRVLHSEDPKWSPQNWIKQVTRHYLYDRYRKSLARPQISQIFTIGSEGEIVGDNDDPNGSIAEVLPQSDLCLVDRIADAFDQVKQIYTKPFILSYMGYTYDEISAVTGLKLGTVKSRITRARRRLQAILSDLDPNLYAPHKAFIAGLKDMNMTVPEASLILVEAYNIKTRNPGNWLTTKLRYKEGITRLQSEAWLLVLVFARCNH